MQMASNSQSQNAQRRVAEQELLRQQGYNREAETQFAKTLGENQPARQQVDLQRGQTERLGALLESMNRQPQYAQALPTGGTEPPRIVQEETGRQMARTAAEGAQQAGAEARLGGYRDWNLANAITNARAMSYQQMINNLARGSAGVLPLEISQASRKGEGLRMGGQLVSALGMLGGMGAAAGAGPGWGSLFGSKVPMAKMGTVSGAPTWLSHP